MKKQNLILAILLFAFGVSAIAQEDEESKRSRKRTRQDMIFEIGMNNYLLDGQFPDQSNEQYTVKPFGSWYVSLGSSYLTQVAGPLYLEWGGDISWYNFKFQDPSTRLDKSAAGIDFTSIQDVDVVPNKSKMTVSYLNVNFVPLIKLGNKRDGFRFGAGVYGGYRLGAHVKYNYELNGQDIKDKFSDNYFVENLRYGIKARMGFRDLDFFANYDLNKLFIEGKGPQVNAISAGIVLSDLFH